MVIDVNRAGTRVVLILIRRILVKGGGALARKNKNMMLGVPLTSGMIVNSIRRALGTWFDRDAAVKRLHGFVNMAGAKTLEIRYDRGGFVFYSYDGTDEVYLKKSSPELYQLARKRYCLALIDLLEVTASGWDESDETQAKALEEIATLLMKFEVGNLELLRIVFSGKQYKWYAANYSKKTPPQTGHPLGDELVRSKSEQGIGLEMLEACVPFHFEERMRVYVKPLVDAIEAKVYGETHMDWTPRRSLFYYKNDVCYWNVPPALEWMNAPGSIWKTYNYKTGEITIYPDFKIMWADGTVKVWEHEGLTIDPVYRCNASERIFVIEFTGIAEADDIILSYERDVDDKQRLAHIIETRVLPGVWW